MSAALTTMRCNHVDSWQAPWKSFSNHRAGQQNGQTSSSAHHLSHSREQYTSRRPSGPGRVRGAGCGVQRRCGVLGAECGGGAGCGVRGAGRGVRGAECGVRSAECGGCVYQRMVRQPHAFRLPRSALRVPPSALRLPRSAFRICIQSVPMPRDTGILLRKFACRPHLPQTGAKKDLSGCCKMCQPVTYSRYRDVPCRSGTDPTTGPPRSQSR